MAYEISSRLKRLSLQGSKVPQIVIEIEGFPYAISAIPVTRYWLIGDSVNVGDDGLYIGGVIDDPNQRNWIAKNNSTMLSQQLLPDRGGSGSTTRLKFKLVDINKEVTSAFSPGQVVDDPLYKRAIVYQTFKDGAHPFDSIELLNGLLTDIDYNAGNIEIQISSPEHLKSRDIYRKFTSKISTPTFATTLDGDITDVATTIPVASVTGFIADADDHSYYIKIGSEIIFVGGVSGSSFVSCIRGQLGTEASAHSDLDDVDLYYHVSAADTSITLASTDGLLEKSDTFSVYIIIGSEIIYTDAISGRKVTGCTRGQVGTTAATYKQGDSVKSMYRFQGNSIDLALKLMISGSGTYESNVKPTSFVQTRPAVNIDNAIYFLNEEIKTKLGLVVGSYVSSVGATNAENNFTDAIITGFGDDETGSYFTVQKADLTDLALETDTPAELSFKSQYDVYPEGCSMTPRQVDIQQHLDFQDLLSTTFPDQDFQEVKTIKASTFINEQVYYASGLYQIPRKGRASCNITLPPLAIRGTKTLDETNVKRPESLSIRRSLNKFFYNEITYKYNYDPVTNEFLEEYTDESPTSKTRIPIGNRPLIIEARGLRDVNIAFIQQQIKRYLARYQYGAESFDVDVMYGENFTAEIGDAAIFGSEALQVSDTTRGSRKFKKRLVEIINAKNDITKGKLSFSMLDTSSTLDGRFATFGPSSLIDSGASTTELPLQRSFGTLDIEEEYEKWDRFHGELVRVRSTDFTFDEEVLFTGFKSGARNTMLVETLSLPPSKDYIVEQPKYSGDVDTKETWKILHPFACPEIVVVSGISSTQIDVGVNVAKFFIGSIIRVHKLDFTTDTGGARITVTNIAGNVITVDDLGFTPDNTYVINLIGFNSDSGKPYRYI